METAAQESIFILGMVEGIAFKVKVSGKSAVAELEKQTTHPVKHLLILGENEDLTWTELREKGIGRGSLINMAESQMEGILRCFAPGLTVENAAWRYEVNSDHAGSRDTVHTHLIVAHRNNFGSTGQIRRCIDDIRKPSLIGKDAVTEYLNLISSAG